MVFEFGMILFVVFGGVFFIFVLYLVEGGFLKDWLWVCIMMYFDFYGWVVLFNWCVDVIGVFFCV